MKCPRRRKGRKQRNVQMCDPSSRLYEGMVFIHLVTKFHWDLTIASIKKFESDDGNHLQNWRFRKGKKTFCSSKNSEKIPEVLVYSGDQGRSFPLDIQSVVVGPTVWSEILDSLRTVSAGLCWWLLMQSIHSDGLMCESYTE